MATRFLRINDDFRDSLEETLDRNNCSGKVRPYYCGIPYEDKIILVPLRSRCPRSYSIPIYNTGGRARPGLDFCKMIIIDRSELSQNTSSVTVNGNIVDNLNRKQNQILAMVRQTVRDYAFNFEELGKHYYILVCLIKTPTKNRRRFYLSLFN